MENQEMVMEKSWNNIFSSLWEPGPFSFPICIHPGGNLQVKVKGQRPAAVREASLLDHQSSCEW